MDKQDSIRQMLASNHWMVQKWITNEKCSLVLTELNCQILNQESQVFHLLMSTNKYPKLKIAHPKLAKLFSICNKLCAQNYTPLKTPGQLPEMKYFDTDYVHKAKHIIKIKQKI